MSTVSALRCQSWNMNHCRQFPTVEHHLQAGNRLIVTRRQCFPKLATMAECARALIARQQFSRRDNSQVAVQSQDVRDWPFGWFAASGNFVVVGAEQFLVESKLESIAETARNEF